MVIEAAALKVSGRSVAGLIEAPRRSQRDVRCADHQRIGTEGIRQADPHALPADAGVHDLPEGLAIELRGYRCQLRTRGPGDDPLCVVATSAAVVGAGGCPGAEAQHDGRQRCKPAPPRDAGRMAARAANGCVGRARARRGIGMQVQSPSCFMDRSARLRMRPGPCDGPRQSTSDGTTGSRASSQTPGPGTACIG